MRMDQQKIKQVLLSQQKKKYVYTVYPEELYPLGNPQRKFL